MGFNENDFFRMKFKEGPWENYEDFRRSTKSVLSKDTVPVVLGPRNKAADLRTMFHMAIDLRCTNEEIAMLLAERGEPKIAKILKPLPVTQEEQELLELLRELAPQKRQVVKNLAETLRG